VEAAQELKLTPPPVKSVALRKVNLQLNSFTFTSATVISFTSGDICFMSFYLLICFFSSRHWRLCNVIVIFCL